MSEAVNITTESFTLLLKWLDPDEERAAEKYEAIRRRLVRVLAGRGCYEADIVADMVFDRVEGKAGELSSTYVGDPALYFYGVANNVFHEWLRKQKRANVVELPAPPVDDVDDDHRETEYRCLETCLSGLAPNVREMIVEYYRDEKRAKIERRRELARRMGISPGALQIKTSRVRASLLECVRNCVAQG